MHLSERRDVRLIHIVDMIVYSLFFTICAMKSASQTSWLPTKVSPRTLAKPRRTSLAVSYTHLDVYKRQGEETCLFEQVLRTALSWEGADHIMFVVGATQSNLMERVRAVAPNAFLLVPGVGAQGGSLEAVAEHAMTSDCGLIVNLSLIHICSRQVPQRPQ